MFIKLRIILNDFLFAMPFNLSLEIFNHRSHKKLQQNCTIIVKLVQPLIYTCMKNIN